MSFEVVQCGALLTPEGVEEQVRCSMVSSCGEQEVEQAVLLIVPEYSSSPYIAHNACVAADEPVDEESVQQPLTPVVLSLLVERAWDIEGERLILLYGARTVCNMDEEVETVITLVGATFWLDMLLVDNGTHKMCGDASWYTDKKVEEKTLVVDATVIVERHIEDVVASIRRLDIGGSASPPPPPSCPEPVVVRYLPHGGETFDGHTVFDVLQMKQCFNAQANNAFYGWKVKFAPAETAQQYLVWQWSTRFLAMAMCRKPAWVTLFLQSQRLIHGRFFNDASIFHAEKVCVLQQYASLYGVYQDGCVGVDARLTGDVFFPVLEAVDNVLVQRVAKYQALLDVDEGGACKALAGKSVHRVLLYCMQRVEQLARETGHM